ncbi:MAG TPA: hypothetical protein VF710_06725 [Longimicrobium sp.]|jgi:DNA-directed RNA polymerase subunit RPC12/RpoP
MPTSRTLKCPTCGAQIQAADMNLSTMYARCGECQSLVNLEAAPSAAPASRDSTEGAVLMQDGSLAPAPPLPVPLPERLTVHTAGGGLRIERRWYAWTAIFLVFFCVVWFGFLAFWYLMAFTTGAWVLMLFPLLHVAVGLFLAYFTAALFVNTTEIVVADGVLTVRHGPLPWMGNRQIATDTLEQLYCEEHVSRGRNGTTITYSVRARGKDGRMVKLVTGLPERDQAMYIEQEVERHLGIADRHVSGQVRR